MRTVLIATTIAAGLAATAGIGMAAAEGTFSAWGHEFTMSAFHSEPLEVAVATEKATGHKMNIVKLKNGHMMALISADRYMALMSSPSDDDMVK